MPVERGLVEHHACPGSGSNGWPQNASEPNEGPGQRYDQEYAKARKLLERALPEFDSAEGDER